MQNHPLEVLGQSRTAQQIAANHRRQPQTECPAVIVLEQAMAFHHDDIQTVMRVAEDVGVVVAEELIKHQAAATRHLRHAHAFGKALRGIQLAEATQACCWIRQTGAGETPGTDGRSDQRTLARRALQPVAEQRQIKPLNP